MLPHKLNLNSVSAFVPRTLEAAREYVNLAEIQLSKAKSAMRSSALADYRRARDPGATDYASYVTIIGRMFERDYRPILRFTEVIYLYLLFEVYVSRHVVEIENLRKERQELPDRRLDILERLKTQHRCSLVRAAKIYFNEDARLDTLRAGNWNWAKLQGLADVRNCVVHNAGVTVGTRWSKSISHLEPLGIHINRDQKGLDLGLPIEIDQKFIHYCLDLLEYFFTAIADAVLARFWPPT